jgi:hypothetical protein
VQRAIHLFSVPIGGEQYRRSPADTVTTLGYTIEQQQRFGPVERLPTLRPL